MQRLPLSAFWFLYLGGLGVFMPYAGLYLDSVLGFSSSQVGLVLAAVPAAGLVAQPLWGRLADRTGSRRGVLAGLAAAAAVCMLVLGKLTTFTAVLLGTVVFAGFQTAVMPVAIATSLGILGARGFGGVRVWGTLGFLVCVTTFPSVARMTGLEPSLKAMFPVVAVLSAAAAVAALACPVVPGLLERSRPGDGPRLLRHRPVARLLLFVFVIHCFIQGPIFLFPLYIASRGGDATTVSRMWLLMLLLEIPLITLSGHAQRRLGARGMIAIGLLAESLRWSTCALTTDLRLVAAVQVLHGVGVVGMFVGAPLYLEAAAPARLRATGQTLVAMAGAGAGAIVSNIAGSWAMEHLAVEAPYAAAGAATLVLAGVLWRWLPEPHILAEASA